MAQRLETLALAEPPPDSDEHPSLDVPVDPELRGECERGNAYLQRLNGGRSPRVFIISGPSGVGKDAVLEKLQRKLPDARYVVTATSRPKRPQEIDGVHYRFLERNDFERQIAAGDFIEHALVYDKLYGVPRRPIEQGLAEGRPVIIKVDVNGAATLRELIPSAISIFLVPESMEALWHRLYHRKTETRADLQKRFRTACEELERMDEFDYVVFNEAGRIDRALADIAMILEVEHLRVSQPPVALEERPT